MTDLLPIPTAAAAPAPPPHPLDALWRVRTGGEVYGPYSGHLIKDYLRDGRVAADSEVERVDGEAAWTALRQDAVLGALVPPPRRHTELALREEPGTALATRRDGGLADGSVVVQINQTFAASNAPLGEYDAGPRNALFAGVLSLLVPGFGQFYNARAGKGFGILILTVVLWLFYLGWIMNLLAAAEAYLDAQALTQKYHRRHGTPQARATVS